MLRCKNTRAHRTLKIQKSYHRTLFILRERENINKTQREEKMVQKSIMQDEDINTSRIRCIQRELFWLIRVHKCCLNITRDY